MKTIANTFFFVTLCLLGVATAFAAPSPPQPTAKTAAGPVTPPGAPIDENIFVLATMAILFGIYIIYRHHLKTKAPV